MTLGAFLEQQRKARGLSRSRWANVAGVSRMTVFRWETDAAVPREFELQYALNALNLTPKEKEKAFALREARRLEILHDASQQQERQGLHRGDLLRALRGRRGWSSEETARQVGVSASLLRKWENLHSWGDDAQIHRLAYVLGANAQELRALSVGMQALAPLAPPTILEIHNSILQIYFLTGQVEFHEPLLFALAHRAQSLRAVSPGVEDFLASLGFLHAGMLRRDGRFSEARRRLRQAETGDLSQMRVGTQLLHVQVNAFLVRGPELRRVRPAREVVAHRLARIVKKASVNEKQASARWQAAMAMERAFVLLYDSDTEAALAESNLALRLAGQDDPEDVTFRMPDRARLLQEMGRPEQIQDELPRYLGRQRVIDPLLHLHLGQAHDAIGDETAAAYHLKQSQALANALGRPLIARLAAESLSRLL